MSPSRPPQLPQRVVSYCVGLGGTGGKIAAKYTELNRYGIGRPSEEELKAGIGRARVTAYVNIVDMVLEPQVRRLIEQGILSSGDDVIVGGRILPPEAYSVVAIKRDFAMYYMPRLLKYSPLLSSQIRLQAGGGASRYRPLARYYIYYGSRGGVRPFLNQLVMDVFARDFGEKIATMRPGEVNIIYTLSLGGGFGSGSLIDLHTIVSAAASTYNIRQFNTYMNLFLPAGYRVKPDETDLVLNSIEESKASAAAALLEILYLVNLSLIGSPYKDVLIEEMGRAIGRTDVSVNLENPRIFIAAYSNIQGTSIEEIYNYIDEAAAALLTVLTHIFPERALDAQFWNVTFPGVREFERELQELGIDIEKCFTESKGERTVLPMSLVLPVAVYTAKTIKLNLADVAPPELASLISDIDETEDRLAELNDLIDNIRERLDEVSARLRELEKIKGKIEKKTELPKDISDIIQRISVAVGNIEGDLKAIRSESNWNAILRRINEGIRRSWTNANINEFISKVEVTYLSAGMRNLANKAKRKLDRIQSVRSVEELSRLVTELEESGILAAYSQLKQIASFMSDLRSRLAAIKANAKEIETKADKACGIFAKLGRASQCRAKRLMEDFYAEVDSALAKLKQLTTSLLGTERSPLNLMGGLLDAVKDKIVGFSNELNAEKAELENELRSKESEIARLKSHLEILSSNLKEVRESLFENIYKHNPFLPASLVARIRDDIIRGLREGWIAYKGRRLVFISDEAKQLTTLTGLINRYTQDQAAISVLKANIAKEIADFISGTGILPVEYDSIILRDRVRREVFLISSGDEKDLFNDIIEKVENAAMASNIPVTARVLDHIRGSYIAAVVVHYNIPIIAVKEFRDLLSHYSEIEQRAVVRVEAKKRGRLTIYVPDGQELVKEYRGERYHVIPPTLEDEKFRSFIENAIKLLRCYEETVSEISI